MGAYSMNFNTFNENVDMDALLASNDIEASYEESSLDAAARVVSEVTRNWYSIMEACAIDELNYLEENSTEMVYEGAKLDSFINKAKEFFKNIWTKIQSIFKKALMQFNSWFKSDKDFLSKYKEDLNKAKRADLGTKEVKFYDYEYYTSMKDVSAELTQSFSGTDLAAVLGEIDSYMKLDTGITLGADITVWQALNKELSSSEKKTTLYNKLRGIAVYGDKTKEVEANEFTKLLKERVQKADSKDDKKLSEVIGKCVDFLGNSEKIKTNLNKALTESKRSIDSAIRCVETIGKELNKTYGKKAANDDEESTAKLAGVKHSVATTTIEILKSHKVILINANSVYLSTLKDCSRQSKSVCVAAVNYKAPKDQNEGAMLQYESDASLLDRVILR